MRYFVQFDPFAEKQLDKLPLTVSNRILDKIKNVAETGRGIEALKEYHYGFKIRIGDYRALVDISYNPPTLWVRYLDHRHNVYKK